MNLDNEKIDAQFTKYLKKVIHNTMTNYYKKKYGHEEYELLLENFQEELVQVDTREITFPTLLVCGYPMELDDEKIIIAITKLKEREQVFLLEEFLMDKTDKEIGKTLVITRQGVTNVKHRIYKKIRDEYNRKKK